jgi:ADP-ribose pyrophosphatase
MSEEILKSEYLYRGKILNVRLDQVRLTDDRKARVVAREIVEHHGAVAIVALDSQDRVLLVRQFRSAIQREILEIPAGTLEAGEDPAKCAVRELKEETGYSAASWEEMGKVYPSPGYATEQMWLYFARDLTASTAALEDDESLQVEIVPFRDAIAMIDRGEIVDAKSIAALLLVLKKRNPK